jgi:type I restriction enzyme R subunit
MLRSRRFEGLKFRRQAPVAGFVVDFLCPELKLVVELDGGVHDLRETEDAVRDARIEAAGFVVLRFRNPAFESNPAVVFDAIRRHRARMLKPTPHPNGSAAHLLPQGEKDQ